MTALAFEGDGVITYVLPELESGGEVVAFDQSTATFETERVSMKRDELDELREERHEHAIDESLTPAWAFPEVDHA